MKHQDREVLRPLAGRVREIADLPEMATRRQRLADHNALKPGRPIILCFPEGSWAELLPEAALTCTDALARDWERTLRRQIYWSRSRASTERNAAATAGSRR